MIQHADNPETEVWRRLLEAAGTQPPAPPDPSVKDYDWTAPNRFTPAQLAALATAAGELAASLSTALTGVLKTAVALSAEGLTQHYGAGIVAATGAGAAGAALGAGEVKSPAP
jgi:hypothetical protein